MKIVIALFVLTFTISTQAQDYRKIVPFKYQNKWGIVDSLNNEIVKPIYNKVNVFDDFMYAEFDGKDLYNLKTGEKQKAPGHYLNTMNIIGEKYHIFNTKKNTVLVNFEKKDSVVLTEKFNYISLVPLYDLDNKKVNDLVVGNLDNNTYKLLNNDKNLTPINNRKFKSSEIETIEADNKIIGFAFKDKEHYVFYNSALKIIKSIKVLTKSTNYYDLLPSDIVEKLPIIYNVKSAGPACFSCESTWDNSWDLTTFLGDTPEESNYYITKEKRYYYLKNSSDLNWKIEIYSDLFNYEKPYEMIKIISSDSSFFCDSRFVKTPHILFPEKYLKELN
ncbi:hypothetical protein JBL43_09305 [Aureibaculum sp. A20]|uniref:WG repeat-containing protein n=1 Tax=Aureibaculum flavum TaxID=2795986 RepID=A0ABS0WR21_9FLAO|nr:hypothetical protein [Aureibaculum flavum]MBJ2174433.1 hypothetical protein [Aureibaculum flavum]